MYPCCSPVRYSAKMGFGQPTNSGSWRAVGYRPQKADGSFDAEVTKTIACSPGANPGPPANPGKPPGGR